MIQVSLSKLLITTRSGAHEFAMIFENFSGYVFNSTPENCLFSTDLEMA